VIAVRFQSFFWWEDCGKESSEGEKKVKRLIMKRKRARVKAFNKKGGGVKGGDYCCRVPLKRKGCGERKNLKSRSSTGEGRSYETREQLSTPAIDKERCWKKAGVGGVISKGM